jgi:carbon monoxide dehydrogenase subunit G
MIRIEDGIEVAAPAERAFAVVTRFEEFPDWLPGVQRAERVGPPGADGPGADDGPEAGEPDTPPAVGTAFQLVSSGPGGIVVTALGRVAAIDPPRSITISAESGLFELAATCTVEPLGPDRSRVTVAAELEPRGLAKFAAGRIEQELRAGVPDALARLRAAVEG